LFERIWHDVRHGLRLFAKSPAFAAIAVISIACGTGANVAMFSAADTLLLRPIPVRDAGGLVTVGSLEPDTVIDIALASYPDYRDIRERTRTLTGLVAFQTNRAGIGLTTSSPRQMRLVSTVSGNFFDELAIPFALGRGFIAAEDAVPGRHPVVVLNDPLWNAMFARDPDVLGRTMVIGRTVFTIVGVTAASFTGMEGLRAEAAFVPIAMWRELLQVSELDPLTSRDFRTLTVKGRVRDDATLDQVRAEMAIIGRDLARAYPEAMAGRRFVAQSEFQARLSRGPVVGALIAILSILSLAVLAVACANVAGLLTSRAPLRARELGLRLALGAGRGRLVAQLLTESLAIAAAGAVGGIALGYAGIALIQQLQFPSESFAIPEITMNARVLTFSLILAAVSAILFGLGPAVTATKIDLTSALRVGEATGRRRWRLTGRSTLVAIQVALSLTVLSGAMITLQTFVDAFGSGPGFRTTQMAKLDVDAAQAGHSGVSAVAFFTRLADAAAGIPGVQSAAVTSAMPLMNVEVLTVEEAAFPSERDWATAPLANVVSERYFDTMGIPLAAGRSFRADDDAAAPGVAIVNETMARRHWPGESAIGKRLTLRGRHQASVAVVGVARDSMYLYPAETPQRMMYLPLRQNPRSTMVLLTHTAGSSAAPLPEMRAAIRRIDPSVPSYDAQTIEYFYATIAVNIARTVLVLVGGIGLMGVAITVVGLYGLVSFSVNRRTREIGIRIAVGATYARVMRMLLQQGLTPAWVGMAAGVFMSVVAAVALPALAPFSATYDAWAVVALLPALFVVTLAAAFIPARRAATINPIVALREE
jgi:predicted permease